MARSRAAQDRANQFLIIFLFASIVVHIFAFVLMPLIQIPVSEKAEETIVEIDPALLDELDSQTQKQIVMSEKSNSAEKPVDPKYLGERDQAVEKETKAARVDTFQNGMPKAVPKLSLKDLAPPRPMDQPMERGDYELAQKRLAREEAQERGGPSAATNDFLKDVADGDRTLLNTKEFIYFGYYHRIRQRLEQSWNSKLRSVLNNYVRSGRRLASEKNYVTRLVVVLDGQGKIRAVKVLEESGARDLDDAAVEAFNRAGPFPNPPKGLIEKDGLIKIRWDFILQS